MDALRRNVLNRSILNQAGTSTISCMAGKIEGYVDTSALIAFLDRSDSHHLTFRALFADPPALLTTTLVIAEGHAWFLRRYDRTRALQFLALIETCHRSPSLRPAVVSRTRLSTSCDGSPIRT